MSRFSVLLSIVVCFGFLASAAAGFRTHEARLAKPKPRPDLSISLTPSLDRITAGNDLLYTITVTNKGPVAAKGAAVDFPFPKGATFSGYEPFLFSRKTTCTVPQPAEDRLTCLLPTIPAPRPGQRALAKYAPNTLEMLVQMKPVSPGRLTATATVALRRDRNPGNNSAQAVTTVAAGPPSADLSVSIASSPARVSIWDDVHYTVSVTNHGPTEATLVRLTDTFSQGLSVHAVSAVSEEDYAACLGIYATLCWNSVAAGESKTIELTGSPSALSQGSIGSIAVVSASTPDPSMANNLATSETELIPFVPLGGVDLAVAIHAQPDPAKVGADLHYTVTVRNLGSETARNLNLSLKTSSAVDFSSIGSFDTSDSTVGNGGGCSLPNIQCSLQHLESGARWMLTLLGRPEAAGSLTATTTVDSTGLDSDPSDNQAATTVMVAAR